MSVSMLPVSGAEQLKGSEPIGERPISSHSGAYSRLLSASGKWRLGRNRFQSPAALALALSSAMTGSSSQRSAAASSWRANTGSAGKMYAAMNSEIRVASSAVRGVMAGDIVVSSGRGDEPTHTGELDEMVIGVAEQRVGDDDAFEVVPDLVLHGHADATVQLDRLLADEPPGAADLHLGGGDGLAPFQNIGIVRRHPREQADAARLLERNQDVGGAVLQHLESADRHAELLAGLEIFDRELVHRRHRADRLGGERGSRRVHHLRDQLPRVPRLADHGIGTDAHARKRHLGGAQAVDRRIRAARDARSTGVHHKQSEARAVALRARNPR